MRPHKNETKCHINKPKINYENLNIILQNLILSQEDDQLFFTSTRNIQPRQELRVGNSPSYCEARGLRPPLQPGPDDLGKLVLVSSSG